MTRPAPDSHRVREYVERMRRDRPVAPLSVGGLDRLLGGIRLGRLNVIAAGPAMGKSTLCGQIAEGAARSGCAVVLATLELPGHVYYQKAMVRASGVPVGDDAGAWVDLAPVQAAMYDYTRGVGSLVTCVDRRVSADELGRIAGDVAAEHTEPVVVVVDWLQLMPPSDERLVNDERLTIKETMRGLRRLATGLPAAVFAVSSIQRQGYARKAMGLEMLGGAAAVEYYADTVIHLRADDDRPGLVEARLIKNRYGGKGEATLAYDAQLATFRDA